MKLKFCGIRRAEDVALMNEFPPDYAGFVFAGTRRRVSPETAALLAGGLRPGIGKVGVFVNENPRVIAETARLAGLDVIQLHGSESREIAEALRRLLPGVQIWKAVRVKDAQSVREAADFPADMLLLDSFCASEYGGTGRTADLGAIRESGLRRPYFLAGGLNSENIARIVSEMSPYGVDISSGIETGGCKDRRKIEAILQILRELERRY